MSASVGFLVMAAPLLSPPPDPEASDSPPARKLGVRRALVVYGTRYGNTKRVAEALTRGLLRVPGVEVDCLPVERVIGGPVGSYDLIAVGGPTEWHNASDPVRKFLGALEGRDLRGLRGFAFDTRYQTPRSGSAAKVIQRRLEQLGVGILMPSASGFVAPVPHPESEGMLLPRTEERFESLGEELAAALLL